LGGLGSITPSANYSQPSTSSSSAAIISGAKTGLLLLGGSAGEISNENRQQQQQQQLQLEQKDARRPTPLPPFNPSTPSTAAVAPPNASSVIRRQLTRAAHTFSNTKDYLLTSAAITKDFLVDATVQTSSFLFSRFQGFLFLILNTIYKNLIIFFYTNLGQEAPLPPIAISSSNIDETSKDEKDTTLSQTTDSPPNLEQQQEQQEEAEPPFTNIFAVLKHKSLFLYSCDSRLTCIDILILPLYNITLVTPPSRKDGHLYRRETPIVLTPTHPHTILRNTTTSKETTLSTTPTTTIDHSNNPSIASKPHRTSFQYDTHQHQTQQKPIYLVAPSSSEKEDWYILLKRISKLSAHHADPLALGASLRESDGHRHYREAMMKLEVQLGRRGSGGGISGGGGGEDLKGGSGSDGDYDDEEGHEEEEGDGLDVRGMRRRRRMMRVGLRSDGGSLDWLNALLGRAFVGFHENPRVKAWLLAKLKGRIGSFRGSKLGGGASSGSPVGEKSANSSSVGGEEDDSGGDGGGLLGALVVQDLCVGDSLPILSNPQLLNFDLDGNVIVEVDIEYTGIFFNLPSNRWWFNNCFVSFPCRGGQN
jgi:hypothetical protein